MARKNTTGPTARQTARQRRVELDRARAALVARIEEAQVGFIEASDRIDELTEQLAEAHQARRAAVGCLVDDESQPVSEVAVLLGIDQTLVKTLRKEHRAVHKTATKQPATTAAEAEGGTGTVEGPGTAPSPSEDGDAA